MQHKENEAFAGPTRYCILRASMAPEGVPREQDEQADSSRLDLMRIQPQSL